MVSCMQLQGFEIKRWDEAWDMLKTQPDSVNMQKVKSRNCEKQLLSKQLCETSKRWCSPSLNRSNQESQGVDLGHLDFRHGITWDPQWSKTLRIFSVSNPPPKSLPEKGFYVSKYHANIFVIQTKDRNNTKKQTPLSISHK